MNDTSETSCPCRGRLALSLNLLALSMAVLIGSLLLNTWRQTQALGRQSVQIAQQGQQVGTLRQHYFGLYSDLVALAAKDAEAAAIVKKYDIRLNLPAGAAEKASGQPVETPAAKPSEEPAAPPVAAP